MLWVIPSMPVILLRIVFGAATEAFQLLWESRYVHDPLHIYRAAELLREAVLIATLAALISTTISSACVLVVTRRFLAYLRDQKK